MAVPRCLLVDPLRVGVYHCVSRCVRRESLLADPARVRWIVARLDLLRRAFAVDVCDFAVMVNHLHLLLRLLPELAMAWSDEEVARRWMTLCPPRLLRERAGTGDPNDPCGPPTDEEVAIAASDRERTDEWRARLADLGWFHRLLKEPCALLWNSADRVSGHFWEGRYHSDACAKGDHLLSAAAYILLNPVHCGAEAELAANPRTSMGARLRALREDLSAGRHAKGVETYRRALLEPVMPCVRGGAAELSDAEYLRRVAEASLRRGLREEALVAARERLDEATRFERVARRSDLDTERETDSNRKRACDIDSQTDGGETEERRAATAATSGDAAPDAAPQRACKPDARARFLRWRSPMAARVRMRLKERAASMDPPESIEGRRNPWRTEAGIPLVEGCTLEAFVEYVDALGRARRGDKPGFIAADAPRAVERLRREIAATASEPPS